MKIKNFIENTKKFEVEDLLKFLAEKLDIPESVELSLFYNDSLLEKLSSGDIEYDALLQQAMPHKYVLYVKTNVCGLHFIICHELIHLKQMERGDLIISADYREITWKGEKFDNNLAYNDREWEQEAFRQDNKLWKEYKKWRSK